MNDLNIKKILFNIIIIIGILTIVFFQYKIYTKSDNLLPEQVKQTLVENKKIQEKIDSISNYNKSLMNVINELESYENMINNSINKNNNLILENNNKIDKIRKIYEKRIDSVSGYSIYQLDSFFAKRYP